jgi:hypothetical protein
MEGACFLLFGMILIFCLTCLVILHIITLKEQFLVHYELPFCTDPITNNDDSSIVIHPGENMEGARYRAFIRKHIIPGKEPWITSSRQIWGMSFLVRKTWFKEIPVDTHGRSTLQIYFQTMAPKGIDMQEYKRDVDGRVTLLYDVHAQAHGPTILFLLSQQSIQGINQAFQNRPLFAKTTYAATSGKSWVAQDDRSAQQSMEYWINAVSYGRMFISQMNCKVIEVDWQTLRTKNQNVRPDDLRSVKDNVTLQAVSSEYSVDLAPFQHFIYITGGGGGGGSHGNCISEDGCSSHTEIGALFHEFLHTQNMGHNGATKATLVPDGYGDPYFEQGSGSYSVAAPNLFLRGWLVPRTISLSARDLRPNDKLVKNDIIINCVEETEFHSMVRVQSNELDEYWLSYRKDVNGHVRPSVQQYEGVYIHTNAFAFLNPDAKYDNVIRLAKNTWLVKMLPKNGPQAMTSYTYVQPSVDWMTNIVGRGIGKFDLKNPDLKWKSDELDHLTIPEVFEDQMRNSVAHTIQIKSYGKLDISGNAQAQASGAVSLNNMQLSHVNISITVERLWAMERYNRYGVLLQYYQNRLDEGKRNTALLSKQQWTFKTASDPPVDIFMTINQISGYTGVLTDYVSLNRHNMDAYQNNITKRKNHWERIALRQEANDIDTLMQNGDFSKLTALKIVSWLNDLHLHDLETPISTQPFL